VSFINPLINMLKQRQKKKSNAGPTPSAHSAPRIRATAAAAADVPASIVRRHTQAVHLRAGPRTTALESGPAPTAVSTRVGCDADAAREPRDPGGRRTPVGHRRQCRFWPGQRIWAVLVRCLRVLREGCFACLCLYIGRRIYLVRSEHLISCM